MKQKYVYLYGNWKMNPENLTKAKSLAKEFARIQTKATTCIIAVAAPALYISDLARETKRTILIGAQNIHSEKNGAYTGEISAAQAKSVGARFTIVGHSERRSFGETNSDIQKKIRAALREGLSVVLCVGEKVRDTEAHYVDEIRAQITEALVGVSEKEIKKIIIAYEPVWAVGDKATGMETPADCLEMTIVIRRTLSDLYNSNVSQNAILLYGGSATSASVSSFLKSGGVQGFLFGRASLDSKEFKKICLHKK